MIKKRVLILATYPIRNPQHGGQKRTSAIYDAYKENFSDVRFCAVFYRGFYSKHGPHDIPLGRDSTPLIMKSPLTGDIICGEAIINDHTVKRKMSALLKAFKPDIIHMEQPFTYLGLKPLLAEIGMNPELVFGSQNIEAPMKREILEGVKMPENEIREAENLIADLETRLSKESDLVIACTPSDLAAHEAMGAKKTALASNGIAPIQTSAAAKAYWRRVFHKLGASKTVLFIASAHPPSWAGFNAMIGRGLGFLRPDERLVIAGSVADYFGREIKSGSLDIENATFWLRAYSAGRVSEKNLGALIEDSEVIVLPITEGGGSNLKTAEAIMANKKVVATSHALRSFEWFRDFPNLWIADTKKDFQQSIKRALGAPFEDRTAEQRKLAARVEWEYCLKDMIKAVKEL